MTKDKSIYRKETGEIIGHCSVNAQMSIYSTINGYYSPDLYYVDLTVNPPTVTARPTNPVVVNKTTIKADGSDTAIFSNIPSGTVCTHDGETYTVTDGMIEFTTTHDGDYDFVFELFPYITASFIITAEESKP